MEISESGKRILNQIRSNWRYPNSKISQTFEMRIKMIKISRIVHRAITESSDMIIVF